MRLESRSRQRVVPILLAVLALVAASSFAPASAGAKELAASRPTVEPSLQLADLPATFIGFVYPSAEGLLASRVRAVGADGVVCGTGEVRALSGNVGFFSVAVVSERTRPECPTPGAPVHFVLIDGWVDDPVPALPSIVPLFQSGTTSIVSLVPVEESVRGWSGQLPSGSGATGAVVWQGANGTPVAEALALLDVPVAMALHYDRSWLIYVPGAPPFLQTFQSLDRGDVVHVRLR